MASLSDTHKRFIVLELACYVSPSAVRAALEERFRVRVALDQVVYYDPTTRALKKPASKWVDLFEATRKAYVADEMAVAIAQRRWRLEQIQRIHDDAKSPSVKLDALERAAKETGDAYTNTHRLRHTGKTDDAPIKTTAEVVVFEIPDNGRGDRALGPAPLAGE